MSRKEFMEELEALLYALPKEEREDALAYYEAYFEDAGENQEQIVIEELGSPKRIAEQILRDYNPEYREATTDGSGIHISKKKMNTGVLVLLLIVLVFTFPIWISVLATLFGVLVGLVGAAFGIVVGTGAGGFGCVVAGVVLFVVGIVKTITLPVVGLSFVALGLLCFGVGCLLFTVTGLCVQFVVWLVKAVVNVLNRWFHGRKEAVA